MNRDIVAHVGYHKTGTSWLQQVAFPGLDGIEQLSSQAELSRLIVYPNDLEFEASQVAEVLKRDAARLAPGTTAVISHERLSGSPFSGGYDSLRLARRLRESLGQAKVLIGIREQKDMLASVYKEYVRQGGTCTARRFFDPPAPEHRPMFDPAYFCFDRLIEAYRSLFGEQRVEVLPFEWLKQSPERFLGAVAEVVGVRSWQSGEIDFSPVRDSLSYRSVRVKRMLNRVTMRNSLNPCPGLKVRGGHPITQAFLTAADRLVFDHLDGAAGVQELIDREFGGHYASSNRRLAAMTGLDLRSLGYET